LSLSIFELLKKVGSWTKNGDYVLQDVGKAVLESYSRVLESLAFNIVSWIEDVLYVDRSMRNREV